MVLGLAVLTAAVAGGLTSAARADNAFSDPAGDATQAPDIVSVSVKHTSTDDVTFEIAWAGGAPLAADQEIVLLIDADKNARTGKDGYEIAVAIEAEDWWYYRWDGTALRSEVPDDAFLRTTSSGLRLELPFHAINESRSFLFYLSAARYQADARLDEDVAPDGTGHWQYTVELKPWILHTSVTEGRPTFPLPGKKFVVTIDVWRAEDGAPVTEGAVQCVARIGPTTVAARGAFVRGAPWCTIPIPRNASGKLVRGTIGVSAHGGRVTKRFAFKVL